MDSSKYFEETNLYDKLIPLLNDSSNKHYMSLIGELSQVQQLELLDSIIISQSKGIRYGITNLDPNIQIPYIGRFMIKPTNLEAISLRLQHPGMDKETSNKEAFRILQERKKKDNEN